ncbi:response regulator [Pararhizobium sp.]|uniref:response regulator n=1 Tax=Pararhizobium sp. TaxID=1977563 RepID=UPI00271E673B|nr:response regulator [Pararhizobium sp.]MDO9415651.1 response regulator [Pararhizobium sp.]
MNDVASTDANIQRTMFEATCDALGMAMLVCDKNDCIVFASRQLLQFYPMSPSFLSAGIRLRDFLGAVYDAGVRHGTDGENVRRRMSREEWISDRISVQWRERFETVERLGRHRWVQIRKRRLSNGMGILQVTDISEQKKREEQIQLDLDRIATTEQILDSIPSPLFVKDRNLTYIAVNKAFCDFNGLSPEGILGRTAWDLLDPALAEKFELSDRNVLETGQMHSLPEQIVRADGEDLWVVTRKYRIGVPGKYLLVTYMSDVTDIATWYEGSAAAGAESLPLLQVKSFDIFEPAQNCYDPYQALDLNIMVETGAATLPDHVLGARIVVTTANPAFEGKLLSQLAGWGFDTCSARNAAEQAALLAAASDAGLSVNLILIDDALPDMQAALFSRQNIPSAIISGNASESGLLSEIMTLCEKERAGMDDIGDFVEETIFESEQEIDANITHAVAADHIDVLVAEDNEINQFVFSHILEGLGLSFRIAENGERAVEMWKEFRPKLVFMDISMPVMNGFDATKAIRLAEKASGQKTPIIAVAAQAMEIDVERCKAADMNEFMVKPVSPDMIQTVYHRNLPAQLQRIAS